MMTIDAAGLPKNTEFDVFVTQLPNAPFGISWYQGDHDHNSHGNAHGTFVGRFSIETFAVAPESGPAPVVHNEPIKDANPKPSSRRCTNIALGSGSTRRPTPRPRGAPTPSPHSTGTTTAR